MTQPYQPLPPAAPDGPAPGVQFASPVARLVGYIIDGLIAGTAALVLRLPAARLAVRPWWPRPARPAPRRRPRRRTRYEMC